MCDVATVAIVSAAVLTAYSKYEEAQAEAAQMRENAKLLEMQAGDARLRGQTQSGIAKLETGQLQAQQTTQYANAGVDSSYGTPTQVAGTTTAMGELKVADIQNQAAREAWGFESNAAVQKYGASMRVRAGNIGAAASIIGGAVAGAYSYKEGLATTAGKVTPAPPPIPRYSYQRNPVS